MNVYFQVVVYKLIYLFQFRINFLISLDFTGSQTGAGGSLSDATNNGECNHRISLRSQTLSWNKTRISPDFSEIFVRRFYDADWRQL